MLMPRRGPTGTRLNELAEASHTSNDCEIIFVSILAVTLHLKQALPSCTVTDEQQRKLSTQTIKFQARMLNSLSTHQL